MVGEESGSNGEDGFGWEERKDGNSDGDERKERRLGWKGRRHSDGEVEGDKGRMKGGGIVMG